MRHRVSLKKLSKTPAHRKAMIRNMLIALYRHEKIKTTFAKSKVLKRYAEKLITRAKVDSVHNRRMVAKWIQDKEVLNKLFTEIAPKFAQRPGGYTRIVKLGPRYGDATEMVYILLVEEELTFKKTTNKKSNSSPKKKTTTPKHTSPKNTSDSGTTVDQADSATSVGEDSIQSEEQSTGSSVVTDTNETNADTVEATTDTEDTTTDTSADTTTENSNK